MRAALLALLGAVSASASAQAPNGVDPAGPATRTAIPVEADWSAALRPLGSLRTGADAYGQATSLGDTVLVGGRVTAGTGLLRADIAEVYIQDATGGLRLVLPSGASPLLVGDSVLVHGVIGQHLGTLEIVAPSVRKVEAPLREILPIRLPDENPPLEAAEGRLVEVRGHVTQSDSTAGGRLLVLISGTTAIQVYAYRLRAAPVEFGDIEVGDYVRVRGIAAQHDLAPPYDNSYIVFPRSSADVRPIGISPSTYRTGALIVAALLLGALLWGYLLRRVVQARTEALRESETRYSHLFDAAADPVLVMDRRGFVIDANERARRTLGVDPEAHGGEASFDLRTLADAPEAIDEHLQAALGDGRASAILELRQADGRVVPFETATRTLATQGAPTFVSIARDVEERRTYEHGLLVAMQSAEEARQAADRARDEAEAAAQLKSSILANMSHEIRTPLTAILGFADILQEELDAPLLEFADSIKAGGERLLGTLNDILDLSRLDADRVELAPEPFDAVEATRASVRLLAPLAQSNGIGLTVRSTVASLPVALPASAYDRIVTNLVGNAIKFTAEGEVRVGLGVRGGRLVLRVRDTGIGIAESFLPDLFEPFKQESNHEHSRSFEGTGLGLAITHRLVSRMDGTIRVWSRKGTGTLFEVELPMTALPTPPADDRAPVASASRAARLTPDPDVSR